MADQAVSQKGTKTRARAATHSPRLATSLRCPSYSSRHVLKAISENGRRLGSHWCAGCSRFFTPEAA